MNAIFCDNYAIYTRIQRIQNMKIINIGGPINSGKTTISKLLATKLPNSIFIEVDELMSDEDIAAMPVFMDRIRERLRRLYVAIEKHISENKLDYLIFAYPMYMNTFESVSEITNGKAEFIVITLNPNMNKCQTNRGTRELTDWEVNRIKEMYSEGVGSFEKSDLIIDNTEQKPSETVEVIMEYLIKNEDNL